MAKAKATTEYDKAVKALIKEYKKTGSIQYDELSDKLAAPYKLDASGIDKLLQKVEDAGISVVDEKVILMLERSKVSKKFLRRNLVTLARLLELKSMIPCGCIWKKLVVSTC